MIIKRWFSSCQVDVTLLCFIAPAQKYTFYFCILCFNRLLKTTSEGLPVSEVTVINLFWKTDEFWLLNQSTALWKPLLKHAM